jgi:UDP-GlcNAc:undecaprenyl-phosphate GlcNAc-1-phosphate transferase
MKLNFTELCLFWAAATIPPLLICWLSLFVVRRNAVRLGLLDHPNERKVHVNATPLGGGLGIWLGVIATFLLATIAVLLVNSNQSLREMVPEAALVHFGGFVSKLDSLWILLAAGTVLMITGLCDDRWQIGWKWRLLIQFGVAGVCVAWQGWRLTAFINVPLLAGVLSVIWIVAMINSFNMLDNMDGLSGGVAMIAALILAIVMLNSNEPGTHSPQFFVTGFLLVIAGALMGFLIHNRPPARIFMGDAGSYFVGFSIAVATLLATYTGYQSNTQHAILAPVFVMAVPMYDMLTVLTIRIREGRSPFQADKCHLSHRLVELGFTKVQAVLTIYLLTITSGLAALLLHRVDIVGAVIVTIMVICLLALIALLETTARRTMINRRRDS